MAARYLAAISNDRAPLELARSRIDKVLTTLPQGEIVLDCERLIVAASAPVQRLGPNGILIGTLFDRCETGAITLDERHGTAAIRSRGKWLIERRWGNYILIVFDGDTVTVVRAPFGDLPCYWTRVGNTYLVASDLALLRAGGMALPSIDQAAMARHLAVEDLHGSTTCLTGVAELPGGEAITLSGNKTKQQCLWSPWVFAAQDRQISDRVEVVRRVREVVDHTVRARASAHSQILLKLSGGLDSSIVAASLSGGKQPVIALNLASEDPAADERDYARCLADELEIPLVVQLRAAGRINIRRSLAARLPRPGARAFLQESRRIAGEIMTKTGCDIIFDGGGGDNLFCSLQSPRPIADCLRCEAGWRTLRETAQTIAAMSQASLWQVLWRAWQISLRQSPSYDWPPDLRFLSEDARKFASETHCHPWLQAPHGSLPGKIAHVALIAAAKRIPEGADAEDELQSCSPLVSQPIVETCLTAASWLWFEHRGNRALARHAFAASLPGAIAWRRSKGAPDCFLAQIYEGNRTTIRELLLEGELRRLCLIDISSVERALKEEGPVRGHDFLRLMQLTDAEVWARCWA